MKVKDYAADHIFSFICLIVSGLLVFGLLWLIEIPIVFIFFEYSNASEPPFYSLRATSDFNTLEPPQTQDIVMEP